MISKEKISHIAKLARLELSEAEYEKMQKDLSGILDYFKLLKQQKTQVKTGKKNVDTKNRIRKDEVIMKNAQLADNILALAPERKERYIKVKSIL